MFSLVKKLSVILIVVIGFLSLVGFKQETITKEKLGQMLFFDPILSGDESISCASCHKPDFAFADTVAFSKGVNGKLATRNTPSVMNVAAREALFWDGRTATLHEQALFPIKNPNEMNLPLDVAVKRLNASKKYRSLFYQVFNQYPNENNLGLAIEAYENTLETSDTPNDRWLNDEPNGLTEQQIRGRNIFRVKAKCFECHFSPDFTVDDFRNIGLFNGKNYNDSGRYHITKDLNDIGKFKVPGLRNIAITAPYMHDGSLKTLREVIDYYNEPDRFVSNSHNRDSLLQQPLHLTENEKLDLEAFLHSLTDDRFVGKR